jgi:hypothetical protein
MNLTFQFILGLLAIAANYLKTVQNTTVQTVGGDIAAIDQATLAVLQQNAAIKGLTIDWSDSAAVAAFVNTLPTFTPIPEPAKPEPIGPEPGKES